MTAVATRVVRADNLHPNPDYRYPYSGLQATHRNNYAANPNCESGVVTGFSSNNSVFYPVSLDTTNPISGTRSAVLTRTADMTSARTTAVSAFLTGALTGGSQGQTNVVAGVPLTFAADIRVERANRRVQAYIVFANSGGTVANLPNAANVVIPVATAGAVSRIAVTATCPAGATWAYMVVIVMDASGADVIPGERVWFDNLRVGQDAEYFDGATPAVGEFNHAWLGAANASQSIRRVAAAANASPYVSIASGGNTWRRASGALRCESWGGSTRTGMSTVGYSYPTNDYPTVTFVSKVKFDAGYGRPALQFIARDDPANDSALIPVTLTNFPVGSDDGVTWHEFRGTYALKPDRNLTRMYVSVQRTDTALIPLGMGAEFKELMIVPGTYTGPYFDGNTPGATWTGSPDQSPSYTIPVEPWSLWDGNAAQPLTADRAYAGVSIN